uniref:Eukaryotic translation initiation factor 3 subunit A n=1 Tax=Molossus molossus TaxID=27622 RepID=A0A7J8DNW5_MOLMO|nr:eukaryotic translation initiation factor 3 subunit A [Molossus molossus]
MNKSKRKLFVSGWSRSRRQNWVPKHSKILILKTLKNWIQISSWLNRLNNWRKKRRNFRNA